MDEILDVVYSCSINYHLLNKLELHKIFNILSKEYNLEKLNLNVKDKIDYLLTYILGIEINNTLGTYYNYNIDYYLKRLYLFIRNCNYQTDLLLEYKLDNKELYLRKNLFILKVLFHEIEHYYQDIIYRTKDNSSITNKLILLEENTLKEYEHSEENRPKKKEYYNISFIERIADINAYKKLIDLIDPIKNEILNLYNLQEQIILYISFDGYIDNDSPTNRYFKFMDKETEYKNIIDNYNLNDLDFNTRFKLGLPLDDYEYQTIKTYLKSKKRDY